MSKSEPPKLRQNAGYWIPSEPQYKEETMWDKAYKGVLILILGITIGITVTGS